MVTRLTTLLAGKRLNLFPVVLTTWIVVLFVLAVAGLPWYGWILVAFLFAERLLLQATIWLAAMMMKEMQRHVMEELRKSMEDLDVGGPQPPVG